VAAPYRFFRTSHNGFQIMSKTLTRRRFIANVGLACGAAAAAAEFGQFVFADETRTELPTACVDGMLKQLGAKDTWSALQAVGADGVQVDVGDNLSLPNLFCPNVNYSVTTPEGIARLAADAKAANRQITSFCMHNRFESRPKLEIKWCSQLADVAKAMNVPVIRIDVVPIKLAQPEFLQLAVKTLSQIMAATEATGVKFAVENHSTTTNDPKFLDALFAGVGSQRLGLTLDIGNFYWFGHPLSKVYELGEAFAARVFHTHCKNIRYPADEREKQRPMGWKYAQDACPIDRGDIDYSRVVAMLCKAGYRHDLCVENEFLGKLSAADATKTLAGEIDLLKRARAAALGK
jgi:sugar phosphate isomerase/epimerase